MTIGGVHSPAFPEPLHVGRPNLGNRERFMELAGDIFDRRWLSNDGPLVRDLESRLADRVGVRHVVAMNNGTIALEIAIRALALTGEVIVPSYTFVATAHALYWQGITPVFADIDPETHSLDPEAVRKLITPKTTGILAVHLWGRPAAVAELQSIADEHGLALLFDAAHAFGASLGDRMIGSFGRAEAFSFHATKFFNTFEGGAVATDDDELAETIRLMRNFGFAGEDDVIHPGTNGKMTEICAAMGLVNLDALDDVLEVNRRNYEHYRREINSVDGLEMLKIDPTNRNNFQYVVALVDPASPVSRDRFLSRLKAENVLARRYFWPGCHRMEPYASLFPGVGDRLPETNAVAEQVLVLPTGTAVGEVDIIKIGEILRDESTRAR